MVRKPALTETVLDCLATCITHAEMVVQADGDECFIGDSARVERADKWLSDMRAWMAEREGAKREPRP